MSRRELLESDGSYGEAPDAGLAAIAASFAAGVSAARPAQPEAAPGQPKQVVAGPDDVWPWKGSPFTVSAATSVDAATSPEWRAPTGWALRITGMMIKFGAGTTLVTVYEDAAQPDHELFETTVSGLWEPSALYLLQDSRLVVVSAGGGVTIRPWGERISCGFLPTYLA